jgi:outer membrane beta-barrel protein
MRTHFAIAWLAVVLSPAWSFAQEVPGIDLTQPPQQEAPEKPPATDGEEQPPIDLSQPPAAREGERPGREEEDREKKETRPLLPFTDEDVALGDRVKAVQRKGFLKRGRLELTPMFSATVNDAFYQKFGGGLRLAYNLQDSFAIAVRGAYYEQLRTDNVREGKVAFQSQLLTSQLNGQAMVDGIWSPVYGKASFLGSSILHFDLFLAAGFGVVWSATSLEPRDEGPHLATDIGGGVRFYPKEWLAFELGLMATLYPDQPILSVPGTVQSVFVANVGLSFFFPPRFEYVYP